MSTSRASKLSIWGIYREKSRASATRERRREKDGLAAQARAFSIESILAGKCNSRVHLFKSYKLRFKWYESSNWPLVHVANVIRLKERSEEHYLVAPP